MFKLSLSLMPNKCIASNSFWVLQNIIFLCVMDCINVPELISVVLSPEE